MVAYKGIILLYVAIFCLFTTTIVAKPQVIVDTDVDIDDLWAISYLAKSTVVEMIAVTTSNNGFSDSVYSVPNVLHLLQQLGCSPSIPVAYGVSSSLLPPTYYYSPTLPLESLKYGVSTIFSCLNQTLDYSLMGSSYYAPELIIDILSNSATPVDFLLLGASTNLATAIIMNPSIISKIGTLYFSGGAFSNSSFTNQSFPYTAKVKGTSWNIFVDPLATSILLRTGLPIRFFSSDAQNGLPLNHTQGVAAAQQYNVDQFLQDIVFYAPLCTGQTDADFDYWDNSAAAYYEQVASTGTSTFCTVEVNTTVIIDLIPNGGFGRSLYGNANDAPATVCLRADDSAFVDLFWSRLGQVDVCPPSFTVLPAVTTLQLQEQVNAAQAQNQQLQSQVANLQQSNYQLVTALDSLSRQVQGLVAQSNSGGGNQGNQGNGDGVNIGFYFSGLLDGVNTK